MNQDFRLRVLSLVLVFFMLGCGEEEKAVVPDFTLLLFQTNDSHSHLLGLPNANYEPSVLGDGTVGGAARIATLVAQARTENPNVMLFSA
ncbi:MAG: hypothetical protein RBU37_19640, partial [Myxococcota bacterium]|nr:hypothetical protein [Myxococcota bacterium]